MNYLYKESTVSCPIDNALVIGEFIVSHHHSTLKVFDSSLNLIRTKHFYEKILNIKRINNLSFIILFDQGKIVQSDLEFNPLCLRVVDEMNKIETHNNYCIAYNQYKLKYFNMGDEEIKDFSFASFDIYSVETVFFMENYIPTLIIVSKIKNGSKCFMVSLDGKPIIVDEFDVIDDIMIGKSIEKFIVFASRNFLQIKYKRENYVINLNGNIQSSLLHGSLSNNVIENSNDGSHEAKHMFLENPLIFIKNDLIFILDSNGELFTVKLKLDVKRIFASKISFIKKLSCPSCLDWDLNYLIIGSWLNDTVIYNFLNNEINGVKTAENAIVCGENILITEKARIHNIGIVKCFEPVQGNSLLLTTNIGVYSAKFSIDFEVIQKLKTSFKVVKIFESENSLIVQAPTNLYKMSPNLELLPVDYDEKLLNNQFFMNFKVYCDSTRNLVFENNVNERVIFENVDCWTVGLGKLAFIANGVFKLIEIPSFKIIFSSSTILNFENQFFNETIRVNESLIEIGNFCFKNPDEYKSKEKAIEILLVHDSNNFVIFRTSKQLYIYQSFPGKFVKCFISKPISFGSGHQSLFNLSNIVYCRSKQPYFIIFKNGISIFPCSLKISYPLALGNWIYGFYKGNLIKCKIDIEEGIISENLFLKRLFTFEKQVPKLSSEAADIDQVDRGIDQVDRDIDQLDRGNDQINVSIDQINAPIDQVTEFQPKNMLEEYRNDPMIKKIIARKDCYIFVVANYEEFIYNPFIPMVHISDPQTGKTHSEPINKEEAEFKNLNPTLRARTLRYSLELRSIDFKLMSSILLGPNEFVTDLRIMFTDFLVLSTAYPEGEDKKAKGKLTVYSLVDIVFDPENPHVTKKLKFISSETFKDPCLYAVEIRSLIAACVGTRLMIYEFNVNTGLCVMGINEVSLLSTCLFSTKNFLAVSDIFNGVFFFFLRPKDPLKIHLLGKSAPVLNCRFLLGIDFESSNDMDLHLSLLAFDKFGTIHAFTYSPEHTGFKNSNLLIKRAEVVTKACYPLIYSCAGRFNGHEALYFSCNLMSTVATVSIPKIQILQHYISIFIGNSCGINPRNYLETTEYTNLECKAVICERILLEFFYFKPAVQDQICDLFGSNYLVVTEMIETCLSYSKQN